LFASRPGRRTYGWKPDRPDPRDHRFVPKSDVLSTLPASVDPRSQDGPIFDQGQLGSCTANGWVGLFMFVVKKLLGLDFIGSRLALYYDCRDAEGNAGEDSGCEVRTGAKVLSEIGVCSESDCPYVVSKYRQKPSDKCYEAAKDHTVIEYMRVEQDIDHLKACLAEGFPIAFGFYVYSSFESSEVARTGIMPMPEDGESILGGHCVEAIGYIDAQKKAHFFRTRDRISYGIARALKSVGAAIRSWTGLTVFPVDVPGDVIICRNSWGTRWGDKGYFYMPYAFISNSDYASDFWTVRKVASKA
jgi:hypothetical protein